MPTSVIKKIKRGEKIIAKKVHSDRLKTDVWIIYDEEVWQMIRDNAALYLADELDEVAALSIEQLKKINELKLKLPGSEIVNGETKQ
jgi:hypothetical protein